MGLQPDHLVHDAEHPLAHKALRFAIQGRLRRGLGLHDGRRHRHIDAQDDGRDDCGEQMGLDLRRVDVLTIWSCEACMLFIYHRLTQGLKQLNVVNILSISVAVGFIVVQTALFTTRSSNGKLRLTRPNNMDIGMKPFNRLGSTTDDADDPLKTQSQEHNIQYNEPCGYRECKDPYSADPGQLKIHKDVTFSVQKTSSNNDDLEAGSMPHHDPSHNHSTTFVTAC